MVMFPYPKKAMAFGAVPPGIVAVGLGVGLGKSCHTMVKMVSHVGVLAHRTWTNETYGYENIYIKPSCGVDFLSFFGTPEDCGTAGLEFTDKWVSYGWVSASPPAGENASLRCGVAFCKACSFSRATSGTPRIGILEQLTFSWHTWTYRRIWWDKGF